MREILFRGNRKDNREWVVGDVHKNEDFSKAHIHPVGERVRSFDVIPETVGMYVGEHINGVEVFENDIIKFFDHGENHFGVVKFGKYSASGSENIGFYVNWLDPSDSEYYRQDLGWWLEKPYVEIVGNAYDNKELIENA